MLEVKVGKKDVNIVFSRELMQDKLVRDFIEKIRVKELIARSRLKDEDVMQLDDELKSNWWQKNKERFLSKIK